MDLLPRIEIDGASKTIGNSVVLDQIQLTVKPGEMIGLQGVNGSGKTMLLRLISGLIYPTKGHVLIEYARCNRAGNRPSEADESVPVYAAV